MSLTFAQLTTPLTLAQARAQVLASLQGIGLVTKTGTGTGSLTAAGQGGISPASASSYTVVIKIVTSGELGAGVFQYSTDGGVTYSGNVTIPSGGSYAVTTTGATVTFVSGPTGAGTSFIAGDQYSIPVNMPNFPVTSWGSGGAGRTLTEVESQIAAVLSSTIAQIGAGGLLQSFLVPTVPPTADAWMDLLGQNVYALTRIAAVATAGYVQLTDAASAGPFTIVAGAMTFAATNGQQFTNTAGGTLTKGGTLTLAVQAVTPGSAGNVGLGTITSTIGGTLPGVTVTNPGGIGGLGGGVWISTSGSDAETSQAYATRCQNRWPSIGIGATAATYDYWARTADSAVTRTLVLTDATIAGQVDIYLAGAAAPVAGGDVTTVQNYINARVPLYSAAVVSNSTALAINIVASATVKSASYAAAVIAAAANIAAYINGLSISGGTVVVSYDILVAMIGEIAGVTSLTGVTVNGGTSDITLTLGQLATVGTVTITWTQV
jgi:Baseplate J-like protein